MKDKIFPFLLLTAIIFVCGCTDNKTEEGTGTSSKCILLCQSELNNSDLSKGPCLSNQIEQDWVCDVAHLPREESDNLPENQCSSFREGKAHHFVEVDVNCSLIRSV